MVFSQSPNEELEASDAVTCWGPFSFAADAPYLELMDTRFTFKSNGFSNPVENGDQFVLLCALYAAYKSGS